MKKLSYLFMMAMAIWAFQACNDSGKSSDSVESANEANEKKQDSADTKANDTTAAIVGTPLNEDDTRWMVKAADGGMMEVQLGQAAQEKAQSQRVKDFGAMMIRDHSKAIDELKALAARKNVTLPATVGEDHQKHINDLNKKTGKDFDKAYMNMMVNDHKEDVSAFEKGADKCTDPDVKSFASNTLPVLHTHLDSAQAIYKGIKH